MPVPTNPAGGRDEARPSAVAREPLDLRREPLSAPTLPGWYHTVIFIVMSSASLFAMCAMGRPGA